MLHPFEEESSFKHIPKSSRYLKQHSASITNINWLMQPKETTSIYSENRMKPFNIFCG
jgi:hypothetical protein